MMASTRAALTSAPTAPANWREAARDRRRAKMRSTNTVSDARPKIPRTPAMIIAGTPMWAQISAKLNDIRTLLLGAGRRSCLDPEADLDGVPHRNRLALVLPRLVAPLLELLLDEGGEGLVALGDRHLVEDAVGAHHALHHHDAGDLVGQRLRRILRLLVLAPGLGRDRALRQSFEDADHVARGVAEAALEARRIAFAFAIHRDAGVQAGIGFRRRIRGHLARRLQDLGRR